MAAVYMPTGPGSSGWEDAGQAPAGSSHVSGSWMRTPSMSTNRTGRCSCAPRTMAATWPISQTSPQAANSRAATTSQKVSGMYWWSRSRHIQVTSWRWRASHRANRRSVGGGPGIERDAEFVLDDGSRNEPASVQLDRAECPALDQVADTGLRHADHLGHLTGPIGHTLERPPVGLLIQAGRLLPGPVCC